MTVEVYKGRLFQTGHERRALGRFLTDLKNRFGEADELYQVVIEVDVRGAALDLLLLSSKCILIADLKELTAASLEDAPEIHLSGRANGPWAYRLPHQEAEIPMGGREKGTNPYMQLDKMRYKVADWLADKISSINGESWERNDALDCLHGWAVVSPGFDGAVNGLDLPWDEIRYHHFWFRVIPLKDLAWEFSCTMDPGLELTERQMRALVSELGATRVENWGTLLPDFFPDDLLPPVAPSYLFTRLPACQGLIGREREMTCLLEWLQAAQVAVICIKGMGGVGKTSLLGSFARQAEAAGWRIKYIACREKELSAETFLAAVASEVGDRRRAHFIVNKEKNPLPDRIDAALDYLEASKTLIVVDDFQKVSGSKEMEQILLRLPARSMGLKLVIASREHPDLMDHPRLPFGSTRELALEGLERSQTALCFETSGSGSLTAEQMEWVWERTGGNPYAVGLLRPLVMRYGWGDLVRNLPLYQSDREQWFESLLETLNKDARQLAGRISVIRTAISTELVLHLGYDSRQAALLLGQLLDKSVLQKTGQEGVYTLHDFLREYLYDHFTDGKQRIRAHLEAGACYELAAEKAKDEYERCDALYEAVFHFAQSDQDEKFLALAEKTFLILAKHGDWGRARALSSLALEAARKKNRPAKIAEWLVHQAELEFDRDHVKEASEQLRQALNLLPKPGPKASPQERKTLLTVRAKIYREFGHLSYYASEFDRALENWSAAIEIIREIGDPALLGDCLMRIARVERQKADFEQSKKHSEEAREIGEQTGNDEIQIEAISHMGLIFRQEGDLDTARVWFTRAFQTAKVMEDWQGVEINSSLLGDLARRQGDYQAAANMFRECLEDSRRAGNGVAIRINLGQLAECLIRQGKLEEARPYLEEVEQRTQATGDGVGAAWTLARRGLFLQKQGDIAGGNRLIRQAIEKLRQIGSVVYIGDLEKDLMDEPSVVVG